MSVQYIKYKNKKLPVKLGYYALKRLQEEHGASMEDMQGDISLYEPMLFYSLEKGHQLEKKEFTFKLEDMEGVLEEGFFQFVGLIPSFFPDVEKMMEGAGNKKTK